MYLVVSKWEILPGKESAFEEAGKQMMGAIRSWPGVRFAESIRATDGSIAVIGYEDEATYRRLVLDPGSPFDQCAADLKLEESGRWVWSERGETV